MHARGMSISRARMQMVQQRNAAPSAKSPDAAEREGRQIPEWTLDASRCPHKQEIYFSGLGFLKGKKISNQADEGR